METTKKIKSNIRINVQDFKLFLNWAFLMDAKIMVSHVILTTRVLAMRRSMRRLKRLESERNIASGRIQGYRNCDDLDTVLNYLEAKAGVIPRAANQMKLMREKKSDHSIKKAKSAGKRSFMENEIVKPSEGLRGVEVHEIPEVVDSVTATQSAGRKEEMPKGELDKYFNSGRNFVSSTTNAIYHGINPCVFPKDSDEIVLALETVVNNIQGKTIPLFGAGENNGRYLLDVDPSDVLLPDIWGCDAESLRGIFRLKFQIIRSFQKEKSAFSPSDFLVDIPSNIPERKAILIAELFPHLSDKDILQPELLTTEQHDPADDHGFKLVSEEDLQMPITKTDYNRSSSSEAGMRSTLVAKIEENIYTVVECPSPNTNDSPDIINKDLQFEESMVKDEVAAMKSYAVRKEVEEKAVSAPNPEVKTSLTESVPKRKKVNIKSYSRYWNEMAKIEAPNHREIVKFISNAWANTMTEMKKEGKCRYYCGE